MYWKNLCIKLQRALDRQRRDNSMSGKKKDIIKKIAVGLPYLSEFDKEYFWGSCRGKGKYKVGCNKRSRGKAQGGIGGCIG